jgi:triosephosphate isomerase
MKLVVGNFKMNLTLDEINDYIEFFKDVDYGNVIFAPSNIYLTKFVESGLKTAAQDTSFAELGAYTGDTAAIQLKNIGVKYSIVGHSERRKYYDDDKYVNDKLKQLLKQEIVPILCIGETKEEKDNGVTLDVLKKEIDDAFKDINELDNIIIAYEPIWSIGTGVIPTNDDINTTISFIKDYVKKKYNTDNKVLYGGSVSNKNIEELEKISVIDGYLVGGCSIKKDDFNTLIGNVK